jgi:hypothetical protein
VVRYELESLTSQNEEELLIALRVDAPGPLAKLFREVSYRKVHYQRIGGRWFTYPLGRRCRGRLGQALDNLRDDARLSARLAGIRQELLAASTARQLLPPSGPRSDLASVRADQAGPSSPPPRRRPRSRFRPAGARRADFESQLQAGV